MDSLVTKLSDAQLMRVIQSCGDFQQALSAISFLTNECDYSMRHSISDLRRYRCYENAAIVAFARPFDVSRGHTVLGLRAIGLHLCTTEEELKDRLIVLRRQIVAHSDEQSMHFNISTFKPFQDSVLSMPVLQFHESLRLQESEIKAFDSLLRKLLGGLTSAIFTLAQHQPERLNVYKIPGDWLGK